MLSLTSFAVIGLAFANIANAEECSTESLLGLASSANLAGCTTDTGVSVSTISTLTMDQVMAVCKSSSCMALMDDVAALNLGDCTIPGSNVSVQTDILDSVATMCSGSGSMGSMGSASSDKAATVGDESGDSSSSSDNVVGGGSSGSSGAGTLAIGYASTFVMAALAMLM